MGFHPLGGDPQCADTLSDFKGMYWTVSCEITAVQTETGFILGSYSQSNMIFAFYVKPGIKA